MKILIINYNRLVLPAKLADWVHARGCEPIIIDNNSDYKPLLKYYKITPYRVMRMHQNYGYKVVWEQNIIERLGITGNYIVTDPDLDLTGIPDDFLSVLEEGLRRYPKFDKCGFSLEINNVTDKRIYFEGKTIQEWEQQYWGNPLDDEYFSASIDTTFALYKTDKYCLDALRTNRPYTAKHVTWYYDQSIPKDELHYLKTASKQSNIIR